MRCSPLPFGLLALSLAPTSALAAMIGNPVAVPEAGRVALGASASNAAVVMDATDCGGEHCQAVWRPVQLGGRAELALLRGVGLQGGGSWLREDLDEAGYSGAGASAWGGLELAVPVVPTVYLAAVGQFEWASTHESGGGDDSSAHTRARVAALLAWSSDDHSFALYGGGAAQPWGQLSTSLADYSLELQLQRAFPVAGVLGMEMRSAPLGLPWAAHSGRVVFGAEAQVDYGISGALWLGAAY
jgi:hypothetical protein